MNDPMHPTIDPTTGKPSNREWMPAFFVDEVCPPWRPTPDAWIDKVENGTALIGITEAEEEFGGAIKVSIGETLDFCWQENVAGSSLIIHADRHELQPFPAADKLIAEVSGCTRVCTTYAEGGFIGDSVDDLVAQVRKTDGLEYPLQMQISWFRDSTEFVKLRLVDTDGTHRFIPAEHVQ